MNMKKTVKHEYEKNSRAWIWEKIVKQNYKNNEIYVYGNDKIKYLDIIIIKNNLWIIIKLYKSCRKLSVS